FNVSPPPSISTLSYTTLFRSSFYALLFRFKLIPRVLASFGLIAAVLMVTAVTMPLFGHKVVFPMLAPMGLSQLVLAVWLITKGFRGHPGLGLEPGDS